MISKLLLYKRNRAFQVVPLEENNQRQHGNGISTSSHKILLNYFSVTARHGVFYSLLITCYIK